MEIMSISQISPDQVILWQWGFITINATILYTWIVMAIIVIGAWLITRDLSQEIHFSRWQNMLEVIISGISSEIREISQGGEKEYLPLIATLFLFIAGQICSQSCRRSTCRRLPPSQLQLRFQ